MEEDEFGSEEVGEVQDELWLTIWLPTSNPLLRENGFAPFEEFAERLGESLEEQRLGYFEGAMTSERTANLSFTLNPEEDGNEAVAIALDHLEKVGWKDRAIVARCGFITREGQPSRLEEVVWPPDFQGELPR